MNRRGFLGLLGKLVTVGSALSVAPEILAPLKAATEEPATVKTLQELNQEWLASFKSKPDWALAS